MISTRHQTLIRLIVAANAQPTDWLISNLRAYRPERDVSRLSLIACLRVLCGRNPSGAVYRERRRAILKSIQA